MEIANRDLLPISPLLARDRITRKLVAMRELEIAAAIAPKGKKSRTVSRGDSRTADYFPRVQSCVATREVRLGAIVDASNPPRSEKSRTPVRRGVAATAP